MTPRLGLLGVGWIGRHRMQALIEDGAAEIVAIAEPSPEMAAAAQALAPAAAVVPSLAALLDIGVDGVVIATPSALHAAQAVAALQGGAAVFCQKPLGRSAAEVHAVVAAARAADRLLAVDLSYRHTAGMVRLRQRIQAGEIGDVYAAELVFHNAYGPDKPWVYDRALSGGGCVMDLGVHLVDLCLWVLGFPKVTGVSAALFHAGRRLAPGAAEVEDYATARLDIGHVAVDLACSWRLAIGADAEISATFHGTDGGACFRNVGGSFYDFTAELFRGTTREVLAAPPDIWGGRAAVAWARQLRDDGRHDPEAERAEDVAVVLDRIYGGAPA